MEALHAMMTRRSIRSFTDAPIAHDAITTILEAAMNAPSAADGRPWQFVVVTERTLLDQLADAIDQGNLLLKQAQAAVLLCLDRARERFPGIGLQDCACAGQNFQLAAHALGLGTVWLSVLNVPIREAGCRSLLHIPESISPFALFPLGIPSAPLPPEYRYDARRIHIERWGSRLSETPENDSLTH